MRKLLLAIWMVGSACASTLKPEEAAMKSAAVPFPFDDWDALLKKYVDGQGRVDYNRLKSDDLAKLEHVFASVAASSPASAPEKYPGSAKLAYYLDAYNVCVWKNVVTRLPKLKNVDGEKASFFYFTKFVVGGKEMNLQDLEAKIIRPMFKDGRIHFALNCASGGCPQLPAHAFLPARVDEQLSEEAKRFVSEKRNVDLQGKQLKLSRIFDWYKEDFGKADDKVIAWINHYRDAKLPTDAKIEYLDYDWTLNDVNLLKR